jgi:hypothetical protein
MWVAYFWKASATWIASSRVGASTSTCGLLAVGSSLARMRQGEGGGLAGAGLGLAEHVAPGQQRRDGGGLDRRRGFVADVPACSRTRVRVLRRPPVRQLGRGSSATAARSRWARRSTRGERWELQLKGAGPTPYSRRADGRAVLRSSIREFLCSEAMHHLGVPTTRALSLVATGETVVRDMFYDGNPRAEPGAIVCRVAPSFLRFGNFEIRPARRRATLLRQAGRLHHRARLPALRGARRLGRTATPLVRRGLRAHRACWWRTGCGSASCMA